MNYEEALSYIHSMPTFPGVPDFNRTKILMEYLGHPEERLKYVHIAGTNGKGSTAAFTAGILDKAGYNVGLFTSPYIERFTERIRIGKFEISEDELTMITEMVVPAVEAIKEDGLTPPTEFDVLTAIALIWFREMGCNIVVLEVGMGGRLDSTNVIPAPEVAAITSISMDHMAVLGNSLEEIAGEKAGIIKKGSSVLLYPQGEAVTRVVEEASAKAGAQLFKCPLPDESDVQVSVDSQTFILEGEKYEIGLNGAHQRLNAAMAVGIIKLLRDKGWDIPEEAVKAGLKETHWPGRFEVLKKEPYFIIDGGHNEDGVRSLVSSLNLYFPGKKLIFIFGVLADKEYEKMTELILPMAGRIFTVTPPNQRALSSKELAHFIKDRLPGTQNDPSVISCSDIRAAVNSALDTADKDSVICAFGSLYYIGIVRSLFI